MSIKNDPLYQELLKKEYHMLDDLREYDIYSTVLVQGMYGAIRTPYDEKYF